MHAATPLAPHNPITSLIMRKWLPGKTGLWFSGEQRSRLAPHSWLSPTARMAVKDGHHLPVYRNAAKALDGHRGGEYSCFSPGDLPHTLDTKIVLGFVSKTGLRSPRWRRCTWSP